MSTEGRDARTYVYTPELEDLAAEVLRAADAQKLRIAVAESCTGGALAALLTDVEKLSHVFDRGFVVYSSEAKEECLGLSAKVLATYKPVSEPVALAMVQGALQHSKAHVAVAIIGYAGPAGPDEEAGLVYICGAVRRGATACHEFHFGPHDRSIVRMRALEAALDLLKWTISVV